MVNLMHNPQFAGAKIKAKGKDRVREAYLYLTEIKCNSNRMYIGVKFDLTF